MSHATIRATLIPDIIQMICDKYGYSEERALEEFYTSGTAASLADDETGLYGQSALFIFSIFCMEMDIKSDCAEV